MGTFLIVLVLRFKSFTFQICFSFIIFLRFESNQTGCGFNLTREPTQALDDTTSDRIQVSACRS